MTNSGTPLNSPGESPADDSITLEFPDWSGCRRELPRVGWEAMHRLSESLLRGFHRGPRTGPPDEKPRAEFVL